MTLTKIAFKEFSASIITNIAIKILTAHGARVRRVHQLSAWKKRQNLVEPGWPDIQGYDRMGVTILCEVKKIGDVLSTEQVDRLTDCKKCGGISLIATQDKVTGNFKIMTYPEMGIFFIQ